MATEDLAACIGHRHVQMRAAAFAAICGINRHAARQAQNFQVTSKTLDLFNTGKTQTRLGQAANPTQHKGCTAVLGDYCGLNGLAQVLASQQADGKSLPGVNPSGKWI